MLILLVGVRKLLLNFVYLNLICCRGMFLSLRYLEDFVKFSVFKVIMYIEYVFLKVNKIMW